MVITVDSQEYKDQILKDSKRLHDEVAPLDEVPMSCAEDRGFSFFCHLYLNPDCIVVQAPKVPEEVKEDGEMPTLSSTPGMGAPVLASPGVTGSGDVSEPDKKKKNRTLVMMFNDFVSGF